jgi:hypothetical protein
MQSRRELIRAFLGVAAVAATLRRSGARAQESSVEVRSEQPVVTRTEFDPRNPPRNMPKLTPPESGVCDATFELDVGVRYTLESVGSDGLLLWIDGLSITTRLTINIFTIAGAPAKLRAHEEGHRRINEHFYRDAASAVQTAAEPLVGRSFEGFGADPRVAEQRAMRRVQAALEAVYTDRTRMRSTVANQRYDELTEHGTNGLEEAAAVTRAIAAAG